MPDVVRKLGRYEIVREVGRGGMAVVYLARQTDLDRVVALKELAAFHAADPAFAERFVRESRIAGSLSHPNIVTVHDFVEFEGTPYIAMEYLERGSLRPLVGRLTLAQVAGVLEGMLAGLAHAETRGIVHRDLKPENVMVTADGAVKIADFGIAKALNQVAQSHVLSVTGTAMGTPAYMSPEQAMSQGIGPWTDLYSTGVIAYELLLGRLPFEQGDTPVAVLLQVVNEPIPPPRSIDPDLDPGLAEWLERMLAKEPAHRPPGAAEAWEELEEIVIALLGPRWRREGRLVERSAANGAPGALTPARYAPTTAHAPETAPREAPPQPPPAPPTVQAPRRRRRRLPLVLAALLAAGLAGLGLAILPGLFDGQGEAARTTATEPTTATTATTATTSTTTTTTVPPAPRPVAEQLTVASSGGDVKAGVSFADATLTAKDVTVPDDQIADGEATFVVWQKDIGTRVGRKSAEGVTLAVAADKPQRLRFTVTAAPGAFTGMSAPRVIGGRKVEISLVAAPPPVTTTTQVPRQTTKTTTVEIG